MEAPTRICVLISGSGSNLQALIDALNSSDLIPASIVLVVSNRKAAFGLQRAKNAGIPSLVHSWQSFKDQLDIEAAKDAYDSELAKLVLESKPCLVVCLGYMRILRSVFLQQMRASQVEMLNLHPALPGEFDGMNAIERAHTAWTNGQISRTGVMIHRVVEKVDAGEVVVKREIAFEDPSDRDLAVFEAKFHRVEWEVVVEGVRKVVAEIRKGSR